jgi:hypothetical protein
MQGIANSGIVCLVLLSWGLPCTASEDTESVAVLNSSSAPVAKLSVARRAIQPSEIAVLINDNDPQSVAVATYYQRKRKIPVQNMINFNFDQNKLFPGFTVNHGIDPVDLRL